jgi:hypothetical protein
MLKSLGWIAQTAVGAVLVATGAVVLVVATIQSAIDDYMDND